MWQSWHTYVTLRISDRARLLSRVGRGDVTNTCTITQVDHGKTTLVDKLITDTGQARQEERVMDSGALEKVGGRLLPLLCPE
jgi:hypothetical protein